MKIKGIDDNKCIKCAECVKECPSSLYSKLPTKVGEKRRVTFEDPYNRCSFCGHCVAICPTDAILFDDAEKAYDLEEAKNLLQSWIMTRSLNSSV